MTVLPIRTRKFKAPKDEYLDAFDAIPYPLQSYDILVISSKIIAIAQGRTVEKSNIHSYDTLVNQEAEHMLSTSNQARTENRLPLTIKYHTFTPSAGIDESNANGYYVLWPEHPLQEAKKIYYHLKQQYQLKALGVIISDSYLLPMRYGSIGISIAFFGLEGTKNYQGRKDLFDRELKMTQVNIADSLATIANFYMGEGDEQTPLVLLRDVPNIVFTENYDSDQFFIPSQQDFYNALLPSTKSAPLAEPAMKNDIETPASTTSPHSSTSPHPMADAMEPEKGDSD